MPKGVFKRKPFTEEHKRNISKNSARFWAGKQLPEEARKKMSESAKKRGIRPIPESSDKKRERMKGNQYRLSKTPWNKGKQHSAIRGEKHYAWKGGIGSERHTLMRQIEYVLWRTAVFERDNYTCQICRKKGEKLHADHIKSWSDYPELRYAIDNGRTLCFACHYEVTFGHKIPEEVKTWG